MGISEKQGNKLLDIDSFSRRIRDVIGTEHGAQAKAAKRLNLSDQQLSNILCGNSPVTVDFLMNFSKVYNCSIDELLGIDKQMSEVISEPSPRMLMSVIHTLNQSGFMHFDKCKVFSPESPYYTQEWYEGDEVTSIVPDLEYLKNIIDVYEYLCGMPDANLKEKTVNEWINNLPDSPIGLIVGTMFEN